MERANHLNFWFINDSTMRTFANTHTYRLEELKNLYVITIWLAGPICGLQILKRGPTFDIEIEK
jgi:hypothetical protein